MKYAIVCVFTNRTIIITYIIEYFGLDYIEVGKTEHSPVPMCWYYGQGSQSVSIKLNHNCLDFTL